MERRHGPNVRAGDPLRELMYVDNIQPVIRWEIRLAYARTSAMARPENAEAPLTNSVNSYRPPLTVTVAFGVGTCTAPCASYTATVAAIPFLRLNTRHDTVNRRPAN